MCHLVTSQGDFKQEKFSERKNPSKLYPDDDKPLLSSLAMNYKYKALLPQPSSIPLREHYYGQIEMQEKDAQGEPGATGADLCPAFRTWTAEN